MDSVVSGSLLATTVAGAGLASAATDLAAATATERMASPSGIPCQNPRVSMISFGVAVAASARVMTRAFETILISLVFSAASLSSALEAT